MVKSFCKVSFLVLSILFVTGCFSVGKVQKKTTFQLNQSGEIDQYKVTLKSVSKTNFFDSVALGNDQFIECTFEVENSSNEDKKIFTERAFELKDKLIGQLVTNKEILVPKNAKQSIVVIYDVKKRDSYSILFYSGIVGNNIEFIAK